MYYIKGLMMEHRITLTKSGTVIVYNNTDLMLVDMAGWVRDSIAFSYEFA